MVQLVPRTRFPGAHLYWELVNAGLVRAPDWNRDNRCGRRRYRLDLAETRLSCPSMPAPATVDEAEG
jgi:hypothetical protein